MNGSRRGRTVADLRIPRRFAYPTSVLALVALSLTLALGCDSTIAATNGADAGSTASPQVCSLKNVPGVDLCVPSAAYAERFLDESGTPKQHTAFLMADACTTGDEVDTLRFGRVELWGPVEGTCPVHAFATKGIPTECEATVSIVRYDSKAKVLLHATEGTVTITKFEDGQLEAHVEAKFPVEAYFTGVCEGLGSEKTGTCACSTIDGKTKTCTTEVLEAVCCNEPGSATETVSFNVTATACPALCACTTDVKNCPCKLPGGEDPNTGNR